MRGLGARRPTVAPAQRSAGDGWGLAGGDVELGIPANPQHRVAGSTLQGLVQNYYDTYGMLPGFGNRYRGYMSIPGPWRASVMLSDLFGSTPWHTYRDTPQGNAVRTPSNALLLEQPAGSKESTPRVFASWALDYLWEGNSIGIYAAWQGGRPTAILPVAAELVYSRLVTDVQDPSGLDVGTVQYLIGDRTYADWQIFHVKGPCEPGALRGMGVLEAELTQAQAGALRLAHQLDTQAGSIAQAGVPTGTLETSNPEAKPADLLAAKNKWMEAQRTRTVAALGPNIRFNPVAWNPEEMQLVEARKFSLAQVELMFGLPVGWLGGATSSRTYSNIEQDAANLLKFSSLNGMYTQFEASLTMLLPRGQSAKPNRDAILKSDTLTRYQAHQIALGQKPWMRPDEVRGIENLAPLGDAYWAELAQPPAPEPPPATDPAADPTSTTDPAAGEESA